MAVRMDLNREWEFTPRYSEAFLRGEAAEDIQAAELPHTCAVTPFHYFDESVYQMLCGYRRRITVPESWAGKRVFFCVGAAGHAAEVYLDGVKLCEHHCGYTAFRVELTARLTPGEEALLVIKLDSRETLDQPPFGYVIDYMTYGGLYREAWLEITEKTYIADVFARPTVPESALGGNLSVARFEGILDSTVTLDGPIPDGCLLRQTVTLRGKKAVRGRTDRRISTPLNELRLTIPGAALWDPESPTLYALTTELCRGKTVLDRVETVIGFRRIDFRGDGLYLNGRKFKLRGLNRHQSYPYVGYAMPRSMQRLDADILKNELGVNAVRTSHYPQSPHFIDRCDELGLLVFTEIPGWQHIGGEAWQAQAVKNTEDMVLQYRNHPSVILWGVRINESLDNDELYRRTNEIARRLDPTRPTSGVRYLKKSSFLEDVYAYNDFSHDGHAHGCDRKKDVTPDLKRAYFISEYNGHMYPTKTFDDEEHRLQHALRHANVLDAVAAEEDIAGSFAWCMFDYNTHREFGSGDRVCYHGVTDMFRNKKLAAEVYAAHGDGEAFLSVSSSMDIGEHPASNRGRVFAFTNADAVRFYKNGDFVAEFDRSHTPYRHMRRPPIEIDDFIGDALETKEGFAPRQARYAKDLLNGSARFGYGKLPPTILLRAAWLMLRYGMGFGDAAELYQKYIGNWGGKAVEFRFDAVKDGKVVASVTKAPPGELHLRARPSARTLRDGPTWDAALVRLAMADEHGSVLPFYNGPVTLRTEGPVAVIGPEIAMLRGGLGGTYLRTTGGAGPAALDLIPENAPPLRIEFTVTKEDSHGG